MKELKTKIDIRSSPETIWNILTDFQGHEKWNPFIRSINGKSEVGERLEVIIQPPGMDPMTMKPRILEFQANREFRWKGHLLIPGIHILRSFRLPWNDSDLKKI